MGVRYLSEGNYEEAIIAFVAAIEIDSKRPDAYLKAAETYLALDDVDSAIAILEQGYEATGDARLTEQLEQLQIPIGYSMYFTEDMISEEDFTIGGIPFYNLTIEEARNLLPLYDGGFDEEIPDSTGNIAVRQYTVIKDNRGAITCAQKAGDATLDSLAYYDYYDEEIDGVATEIRDISTGDTMKVVLEKIGVASDGANLLSKTNQSILIGANRDIAGGYGWIEATEDMASYNGIETRMINICLENGLCQMDFIDNVLVSIHVQIE